MTKKEKVKELIVEVVKSYNTDWNLNLDLTEFIDTQFQFVYSIK